MTQHLPPGSREPALERRPELAEGWIYASAHNDRIGEFPVQLRGQRCPRLAQHGSQRPLRIRRLRIVGRPQPETCEPFAKAAIVTLPPEDIGNVARAVPDPGFQLGLDDDGLAAVFPAIPRQATLHVVSDRLPALPRISASVLVEHHDRISMFTDKPSQAFDGVRSAPGVSSKMTVDRKRDRLYPDACGPIQQAFDPVPAMSRSGTSTTRSVPSSTPLIRARPARIAVPCRRRGATPRGGDGQFPKRRRLRLPDPCRNRVLLPGSRIPAGSANAS